MELRAGLLGVATYLPPEIRRNDWWPCATVERWQRERTTLPPPAPRSEAMARVLAAMAEQALDPFGGVVERRDRATIVERENRTLPRMQYKRGATDVRQ